jgi:hypothetical protein
MSIVCKILDDGAFVVGDTVTRRTSYAFPTSASAKAARKKNPGWVAAEMIGSENATGSYRDKCSESYDRENWNRLESKP